MIPALKWAAMRAILTFHNFEGQSHKTVSTDHNFWRQRRAEADSNRCPSACQSNDLPLGQTGSPCVCLSLCLCKRCHYDSQPAIIVGNGYLLRGTDQRFCRHCYQGWKAAQYKAVHGRLDMTLFRLSVFWTCQNMNAFPLPFFPLLFNVT